MNNYNPFSLEGKTILVTGASSGIGKAIAIECSKMGACVIVTGRNRQRLEETFGILSGSRHGFFIADINNAEEIDELIAKLPQLDGIVHCAGIVKTLPFQFVNKESLSLVMNINFMAPTIISAQLIKKKKLTKAASIVFISSVSGTYCTVPANSMYTASKSAIDGIAKGMALDLAHKNIRVNTINPGMIDTNILDAGVITETQLEEDKKRYPLGRYGKPEEVAYAAIYLLSDASRWVTGINLLIDGGVTLQ
jgi:NAD(P)-dependent dehydrogenase (short-subunit alcohol dehydrogenase family)